MNQRTRQMITLGMLCAIAYLVLLIAHNLPPVVLFLRYDPKDVIIVLGGFIYGPLSAFVISAVVSFVEMFTISNTGPIGLVMNILSTCAFACTAAVIYKYRRTMTGAVIGLVSGVVAMTAAMLLWNYFLTPIYMGYPREQVAAMLATTFLPFNALKGGLNAALSMLVYKPIVGALRRSRLIPEPQDEKAGRINAGVMLISATVLATCILLFLVLKGVI